MKFIHALIPLLLCVPVDFLDFLGDMLTDLRQVRFHGSRALHGDGTGVAADRGRSILRFWL